MSGSGADGVHAAHGGQNVGWGGPAAAAGVPTRPAYLAPACASSWPVPEGGGAAGDRADHQGEGILTSKDL